VRTKTVKETADTVFELIFSRYGSAETVYTMSCERTAFSNAIMKAQTKSCGSKFIQQFISASPSDFPPAESRNSNISKTLKTLITDQKEWAKLLPAVCLSYRSTPTVAHGFTSAKLVYDFYPSLPINLTLIIEVNTTPEVDVYLRDLVTRLEMVSDSARFN
jgi:hypothetical protein